jgi:ribosomal protein S27E
MAKFLRIKCKCGNEQTIFERGSTRITCNGCSEVLAEPTGGEPVFYGKIVKELG